MVYGRLLTDQFCKRVEGVPVEVEVELSQPVDSLTLVNHQLKEGVEFRRREHTYVCNFVPNQTGLLHYYIEIRQGASCTRLQNREGKKIRLDVQVDPEWLVEAVFYCVFVRFFRGKIASQEIRRQPAVEKLDGIAREELASKSITEGVLPGEGGTFDDVKAHLDTLAGMNIKALYFNPIHVIGEVYRGYNMLDQLPSYLQPGSPYSIKDYKSIDPELTYDRDTKRHLLSDPGQEFRDLVAAAHERGMYIIMDLVFNHTAHDFVLQRIRPEWYLYKETITSLDEPYLYPEDIQAGKPWGDPKHSVPPYDHGVWWEDCAQLNWEYLITPGPNDSPPNTSLGEMWEYFASIPQYWVEHFGVDGFRCDVAYRVPPDFWRMCIAKTRAAAKKSSNNLARDVVFIAESYTSELDTLQRCGFSAVYGDFSHKVAKPVDLKGYLDYIYGIDDSSPFPDGSLWFHFPDSHDFDRSPRKVLGEDVQNTEAAVLANQSRWTLTATLPGLPLIFNGFEKVEWQPINIWAYGAIQWEKDADLREYIAKINMIRSEHPALQKGRYTYIPSNQGLDEGTQIFAFERKWQSQRIVVVVNMDVYRDLGPTELTLPDWYQGKSYSLHDLLTGEIYEREDRYLLVQLTRGQSHIFLVEY